VYRNFMYVVGGYNGISNVNDTFKLNLDTFAWEKVMCENQPSIRGHTSVVHGNSCYTLGGTFKKDEQEAPLWEFDLERDTWTELDVAGDIPSQRRFHMCALWNNRMYIFGGLGKGNLNDMFEFTFEGLPDQHSLASDLHKLVNNQKYSDICFNVSGKTFYAHKNILSTRSELFLASISSGMKESQNNVISLNDIEPEVFEYILTFLYTGSVRVMPELAINLLIVSDRFLLRELKEHTEKVLARGLTAENVPMLSEVADKFNANKLKEQCFEFIYTNKIDPELLSNKLSSQLNEFVTTKKSRPQPSLVPPISAENIQRQPPAAAQQHQPQQLQNQHANGNYYLLVGQGLGFFLTLTQPPSHI